MSGNLKPLDNLNTYKANDTQTYDDVPISQADDVYGHSNQ